MVRACRLCDISHSRWLERCVLAGARAEKCTAFAGIEECEHLGETAGIVDHDHERAAAVNRREEHHFP